MAVLCDSLFSACAIFPVILIAIFIFVLTKRSRKAKRNICIVVLGDIGRSPRMQYHANSFTEDNFHVNIVGFRGTSPVTSLRENAYITFTYLTQTRNKPSWIPGSLYYIWKALHQCLQLLLVLTFLVEKPRYFLVQNPPAIPTLSVVWLVSRLKGSCFIIDWHNYAYTILAMNLKNDNHILTRFSKWYEGVFGYLSDKNLCVTEAMKNDLYCKWGITAEVLYDRPPVSFKETSLQEKHELFSKLSKEGYTSFAKGMEGSTIFTNLLEKEVVYDNNRPALIISSTSWTEDEDFSILLTALECYDNYRKAEPSLPRIICVITGKGPQKSYYQNLLKEKNLSSVQVLTPWLSAEDYPKLIGSGDLGICLHTSSSGLDLPMKVVDMFGCGLPVCAVSFSCLNELVKHNENGLVFGSPSELCDQIVDLLKGFPNDCEKLLSFRENLSTFQALRWHENWSNVVLPLLTRK